MLEEDGEWGGERRRKTARGNNTKKEDSMSYTKVCIAQAIVMTMRLGDLKDIPSGSSILHNSEEGTKQILC